MFGNVVLVVLLCSSALTTGAAGIGLITLTTVASNRSIPTALQGCELKSASQKCTWRGPLSQVLHSGQSPEPGQHYKVTHPKGDSHCYLSFSRIEPLDEGLWNCTIQGETVPSATWRLIVQVTPSPPKITFTTSGTTIDDDTFAFDVLPHQIDLTCISINAKPAQSSMTWIVNGRPMITAASIIGADYFNMSSSTAVILNTSEQPVNVTCVVEHKTANGTGIQTVSKMFGLKNTNHSIRLLQEEIPSSTSFKILKCQTFVFPWPQGFEIVRVAPPPERIYNQKEVNVSETGSYKCRAKLRSSEYLESSLIILGNAGSVQFSNSQFFITMVATTLVLVLEKLNSTL